jgi:hypothetical protein
VLCIGLSRYITNFEIRHTRYTGLYFGFKGASKQNTSKHNADSRRLQAVCVREGYFLLAFSPLSLRQGGAD